MKTLLLTLLLMLPLTMVAETNDLAIINCSPNVYAGSYYYGSVGKYPVVAYFKWIRSGVFEGWYYYKSKGANNKIGLSSEYDYDSGKYVIYEYVGGYQNGYFIMTYNNGRDSFTGYYYSPEGKRFYTHLQAR